MGSCVWQKWRGLLMKFSPVWYEWYICLHIVLYITWTQFFQCVCFFFNRLLPDEENFLLKFQVGGYSQSKSKRESENQIDLDSIVSSPSIFLPLSLVFLSQNVKMVRREFNKIFELYDQVHSNNTLSLCTLSKKEESLAVMAFWMIQCISRHSMNKDRKCFRQC